MKKNKLEKFAEFLEHPFTNLGVGICTAIVLPLSFELSGLAKHFQEYQVAQNQATTELREEYFGRHTAEISTKFIPYLRYVLDSGLLILGFTGGLVGSLKITNKVSDKLYLMSQREHGR